MDNDIEFGNIDVKYYLSCVSEAPLWVFGSFLRFWGRTSVTFCI